MLEFLRETLLGFLTLLAMVGYWVAVGYLCELVGRAAKARGYRGDGAARAFFFVALLLFIAAMSAMLSMFLEGMGI